MIDRVLNILLIEQNAADAAGLWHALTESRFGKFSIVHVGNCSLAAAAMRSTCFDAIVLGLNDTTEGLYPLRQLRKTAGTVPIVVLTAEADEQLALAAQAQGAQDHLNREGAERSLARAVRYVIERHRANQAVNAAKMAEQRLEMAVDAAKVGIWDWDVKTGRIIWTPLVKQMLGTLEPEVTYDVFERCVHSDDLPEVRRRLESALRSGEPYRCEYRVIWPDRSIHWIEGRGQGTPDESGKASRMTGTVMDITARKNADALAKARDAEVAHLSRFNTVGQLAAGLAHELNQPLGAISNYAGLCLERSRSDGVDAFVRTALNEIMKETGRAGAIIGGLRSFVRKRQPSVVPAAVNELIGHAVDLLAFEFRRAGVRPELVLEEVPAVLADPVQIEQVLVNLICNALESICESKPTPARLSVETKLDAEQRHVKVIVTDNGNGPACGDLGRLFDPFFTTKEQGLGMGLKISRSIVESHGGNLTASRADPQGMRFCFTLPVQTEALHEQKRNGTHH